MIGKWVSGGEKAQEDARNEYQEISEHEKLQKPGEDTGDEHHEPEEHKKIQDLSHTIFPDLISLVLSCPGLSRLFFSRSSFDLAPFQLFSPNLCSISSPSESLQFLSCLILSQLFSCYPILSCFFLDLLDLRLLSFSLSHSAAILSCLVFPGSPRSSSLLILS